MGFEGVQHPLKPTAEGLVRAGIQKCLTDILVCFLQLFNSGMI